MKNRGGMVLGKTSSARVSYNLYNSRTREGPPALAVGAGRGCLDIFTLIYHFSFSPLSLSLCLRDGPI